MLKNIKFDFKKLHCRQGFDHSFSHIPYKMKVVLSLCICIFVWFKPFVLPLFCKKFDFCFFNIHVLFEYLQSIMLRKFFIKGTLWHNLSEQLLPILFFSFNTNHRHLTTLTTTNPSMQEWWKLLVKLKITIRWCVHFKKWNLCWIIGIPLGCCDDNHVDIAMWKGWWCGKYMNLSKYIISTFEEFVQFFFLIGMKYAQNIVSSSHSLTHAHKITPMCSLYNYNDGLGMINTKEMFCASNLGFDWWSFTSP